jgi:hypothetical protein
MVLKMQHGGFAGNSGLGGLLQPLGQLPAMNLLDSGGNPPPLLSVGPGPIVNRPGFGISRPMPLPDYNIGRLPPTLGIAQPDYSGQFEKFGETLGGYSSQFDKFGEQLGGLGEQMTGYQDALGSFNEQMGGMGKQFETISNRLDSVDKGLGSLGNQIASLENMQKAQPQEVRPQPQRPAFNPFNPFGFGGLGSLFGRRY